MARACKAKYVLSSATYVQVSEPLLLVTAFVILQIYMLRAFEIGTQPVSMAMRSCHKALLIAGILVVSFWVSFIFGGKQAQFNDWHYDYQVLSYGLNRPEKHDSLGRIPSKFKSTRGGWTDQYAIQPNEMAYR